ncbi:unnamed protein product [Symbiodinium natans]|uniref:Uncharacterized protein n=1 Tax=Symbiodinium natans TaxID=878477 RepID=A0A812IJF7_9DINO|nr:unnamed protein product [Symbiodinium natans]
MSGLPFVAQEAKPILANGHLRFKSARTCNTHDRKAEAKMLLTVLRKLGVAEKDLQGDHCEIEGVRCWGGVDPEAWSLLEMMFQV